MFNKNFKNKLLLFLLLISSLLSSQIEEADECFKNNQYLQAIPHYEKALKNENDEDNLYILKKLAESYNKLYWEDKQNYIWYHKDNKDTRENYNQALNYTHKALKVDENDKEMLGMLTGLYYMNKDVYKAFFYAEKYKKLYSKDNTDISYMVNSMYDNLITYLVETSSSLKEKEKYINKIEDLDKQFNYLYVEYLIQKNDEDKLKDYVDIFKELDEEIDYKYIINRSLKFNKLSIAVCYLSEKYTSEKKIYTQEQVLKEVELIQKKYNEIVKYFKNISEKNYKSFMLKPEEELNSDDIKALQNINYDIMNIYKEKGEYLIIVDLQQNSTDAILYGFYGDIGVHGYELQIVNTSQGYKVQIFD